MPPFNSSVRPARSVLVLLSLALLALLALPTTASLSQPQGHARALRRAGPAHHHGMNGWSGEAGERRQLLGLPDVVVNAATVPASSSSTAVQTTATPTTARTPTTSTPAATPDPTPSTSADTNTQDATSALAGVTSASSVVYLSSALTASRTTGTITVVVTATGTALSSSLTPANTSTVIVAASSTSQSATTSAQPTLVTSVDRGTTLVKTVTSLAPNSNSTLGEATGSGKSNSGGLGTGAIAAIAVVGGLVVLALAGFVLWKVKRRNRFGGDYDDEDGIKWPELNKHGDASTLHPLPARPTGGHGLETNALDRSETDLDGEPIGGHDTDFDYAYPPHAASLRHDDGMGGGYYDHSPPPSGGGYDEPGAGGPSYLTLNREGAGGIASSEGPFDDAHAQQHQHPHPQHSPDALEYEGSIGHHSLGGTQAFEASPADNEMRMLGGPASMAGVGRSKSGRLL